VGKVNFSGSKQDYGNAIRKFILQLKMSVKRMTILYEIEPFYVTERFDDCDMFELVHHC
jgi:hypothetical protein